jgi:ribosomal protein S27E
MAHQLFPKSEFLRLHPCPVCRQRGEHPFDEARRCWRCLACGRPFIVDANGQTVECPNEPAPRRPGRSGEAEPAISRFQRSRSEQSRPSAWMRQTWEEIQRGEYAPSQRPPF